GWWSSEADQRLILFSIAGLPIRPRGPTTARALTNVMVGSLAAKLLETARNRLITHKAGSRACPFYFNASRDFDGVAGPREFDRSCRDALQKHLAKELQPATLIEAFEEMFRRAGERH